MVNNRVCKLYGLSFDGTGGSELVGWRYAVTQTGAYRETQRGGGSEFVSYLVSSYKKWNKHFEIRS